MSNVNDYLSGKQSESLRPGTLALRAAFLVPTELFINHATAGTHKTTLIAQLATLLVIRIRSAESWKKRGLGLSATIPRCSFLSPPSAGSANIYRHIQQFHRRYPAAKK